MGYMDQSIGVEKTKAPRYADNLVLCAQSGSDLQKMVDAFDETDTK